MKKWLLASLVIAIPLMFAAPISAEPKTDRTEQAETERISEKGWFKKADFIEKYNKEWRELNKLKKEKLELRIQMLDQREQLADLLMEAKKQNDITKLKPAMELHQTMKALNKESKELKMKIKEQRGVIAEAMKSEDHKQMKQALKQMIELNKQQNKLCEKKNEATNKLIKQLSK